MARLEGAYEQAGQRLITIDQRFDGFDRKIEGLDPKIDARFGTLDARIDQHFRLTVGLLVTGWLTSIGASVFSIVVRH